VGNPAAGTANLADLVRHAAVTSGDQPALRFRDQVVTWAELDAQVDAVARGLASAGRTTGDRVALALGNVPDFVRCYFGILRAGLVAVPVNPGYRARELAHVLGDSGAATLIANGSIAAEVAGLRGELPTLKQVYVPGGAAGALDLAELVAGGEPVTPETGGEDLAVLLYTSGTEGKPKGAMLSHRAMLANLDQLDRIEPPVLRSGDVVLLALPLFHSYGLGPGLHAIARHGAAGVLVERFDPADTLEALHRHEVTVVIGVPQMYLAWSLLDGVGEAFASVRVAVSGAAPLEESAHRRFLEATRHHIFEGYGLTEAAPVLASTLLSPVPKPGSVGRPIPGVELKLIGVDGLPVEDDDDNEEGSPGTDPGEIWARGANLFSGYWPDGRDGPNADGWWPTADMAYADQDGDLFLVDRLRELVLVSGFNVYPREVEQVLAGHPAVHEAAALGVPHPYTGETVKVYVVLKPGTHATVDELIAYCEGHLARFKCPTSIEFVASLPHSITGKVRKSLLRDGLPQ
jgi:long-chain acyl-CoA synthetase